MQRGILDFWVGLFVIGGIAALLFLAIKVSTINTVSASNSYAVTADFNNIGGLKVRAPVKSAGVVVGRVAKIAFDNNNFEALVTFRLDNRYQFPADTSASILTSGLLGEQYVALQPGGDTKNLANGSKIQITQSAVVLENLISQFIYNKAQEKGAGHANP